MVRPSKWQVSCSRSQRGLWPPPPPKSNQIHWEHPSKPPLGVHLKLSTTRFHFSCLQCLIRVLLTSRVWIMIDEVCEVTAIYTKPQHIWKLPKIYLQQEMRSTSKDNVCHFHHKTRRYSYVCTLESCPNLMQTL